MMNLACAYRGRFAVRPDDSDEVKEYVIATWHKYLGDLEFTDFETAVQSWILYEDQAPSIRQIRNKAQELQWKREGYSV